MRTLFHQPSKNPSQASHARQASHASQASQASRASHASQASQYSQHTGVHACAQHAHSARADTHTHTHTRTRVICSKRICPRQERASQASTRNRGSARCPRSNAGALPASNLLVRIPRLRRAAPHRPPKTSPVAVCATVFAASSLFLNTHKLARSLLLNTRKQILLPLPRAPRTIRLRRPHVRIGK